ncbi:5' nucleotidase, NT5C type [Weissella confusa]
MTQPKLFLDMDNVLVDTLSVLNQIDMSKESVVKPDQIPGVFRDLPPIPGAIEAVNRLANEYEIYILSTAPWHNPSAWQDKLIWLQHYFGAGEDSPLYKRVIMAHDKSVAHYGGGILVDDRPYHGASDWDDETSDSVWLQFGADPRLVWDDELVDFLMDVSQVQDVTENLREAVKVVAERGHFNVHGDKATFDKAHWE